MCDGDTVWSFGHLRSRGLSRRTITRALETGSIRRIRFGVYASERACGEIVAAALHGGGLACVSAARHSGLWTLPDSALHIWMGDGGHERTHDSCACTPHWTHGSPGRAFAPANLVDTLLQLLNCCGEEAFFVALESALHQNRLPARLRGQLVERLRSRGRELLEFARADAESGLESLFRLRLRWLGDRLRSQISIAGVGRVDFLIDGRLIVEVDGRLGHDSHADRAKDLMRDATATSWGYTTVRFTYAMIIHDWDLVEAAITRALAPA